MQIQRPLTERFMERLKEIDRSVNGCHNWPGAKKTDGYGVIGENSKILSAHRVAYSLFVGPIPEGMIVMHSCDNPSCVNPEHLSVGTDADNMADRDKKGRTCKGIAKHSAKITPVQVREIRKAYCDKSLTGQEMCKIYNLSSGQISQIARGIKWRHIK